MKKRIYRKPNLGRIMSVNVQWDHLAPDKATREKFFAPLVTGKLIMPFAA